MNLPNSESAVVDDAKVRDYLLSPEHPVGRFKARVFRAAGYRRENWPRLRDDLAALARTIDVTQAADDEHGHRFVGRGRLPTPSGRPLQVVTVWLIPSGSAVPHYGVSGKLTMNIRELDSVVLERDLPEHGLQRGDLGAVVQVYSPESFEVEFVRVSGGTQAVVRLSRADIRPVADNDLPAVRPASRRGAA